MRGVDCTPGQLRAAELFVLQHSLTVLPKNPRNVTLDFDDLVRLVAWYGALRFEAGRDGNGGTLECPGETVSVRK